MTNSNGDWRQILPDTIGTLPIGMPLRRTEASCPAGARFSIIGVYPAATRVRARLVAGTRMMLPEAVELHSFAEGSASGRELDLHYLSPLGLCRAEVGLLDMMPNFLANTTKSKSGRSMHDNVRAFEAASDVRTGIAARPTPEELVELARTLPGNQERIRDTLSQVPTRVVFTVGLESAAFVRGVSFREVEHRADELLYAPPARIALLGCAVQVVHLVHPHLFIKRNAKWMERHRLWVVKSGRPLVAEVAGVK
jgi:hypothetical protein